MRKRINKILNKLETIFAKKKLFSYPRYIQLEPTNRCNQKCIMCPRNEPNYDVPFGDISFEDYLRVLNQIPTISNMQLNGLGEPLLHPRIFEMIKEAKKRKIVVTINSNLVLINSLEKARKLVDSGLDVLKVSLDTANPETYQQIRNADGFNQAIKAIKFVMEARGKRHRPQIWFNSIIMQKNYKHIGEVLKLGDELGIDFVRFKPIDIFDIYKDKNLEVASREDLFAVIKKTREENKNLKVKNNLQDILNNFSNYYRPKGEHPCFSPWLELYIQYYGGVRLCCEFYDKKYDIGNILKEDFKKIWNGSKMQQIREKFSRGNTYFPVCQTCTRFQKNISIQQKINKLKYFRKN